MGSQTLEILRQGVWASLTGGWFYDPHQGVFCNIVHLYLWLYLLCSPFVAYLYFPGTWLTWCIYCILTTLTIFSVKIVNMGLHRLYDRAQNMSEGNLKNQYFKVTKDSTSENENGIELKELRNDGSRNSVEQTINEVSEENSIMSMENVNSIIDLKVDVHRKHSSESIELMFYAPSVVSGNSQRDDQQSLAGSASVSKSIRSNHTSGTGVITSAAATEAYTKYLTEKALESGSVNSSIVNSAAQGSNNVAGSIDTPRIKRQPRLMRKSSEDFRKRAQRRRLERQSSLDAAAESAIASKLTKNTSELSAVVSAASTQTPQIVTRNETFLHSKAMTNATTTSSTTISPSNTTANSSATCKTSSNAEQRLVTTIAETSSTEGVTNSLALAEKPSSSSSSTKTSRLQRHRSSETHDERLKQQIRSILLPVGHPGDKSFLHHHHHHQRHHSHHNHNVASSSGALAANERSMLDSHDMEMGLQVKTVQSWILGSLSDVYFEDDGYTKSDFGIEQLDSRSIPSAGRASFLLQQQNHLNSHYHHQQQLKQGGSKHSHYRKDSNSTKSALHLSQLNEAQSCINDNSNSNKSSNLSSSSKDKDKLSSSQDNNSSAAMKIRRHSNSTAFFRSTTLVNPYTSNQLSVRRIKSTALEVPCAQPSISNLSPHPNSVEAINGQQQIKNPPSALLPPPSKTLVRNAHFDLRSKLGESSSTGSSLNFDGNSTCGSTTALIEPLPSSLEMIEHHQLHEGEPSSQHQEQSHQNDYQQEAGGENFSRNNSKESEALVLEDISIDNEDLLLRTAASITCSKMPLPESYCDMTSHSSSNKDNASERVKGGGIDDDPEDIDCPFRRLNKALDCQQQQQQQNQRLNRCSVESDVGEILADNDVDEDEFKDFDDNLELMNDLNRTQNELHDCLKEINIAIQKVEGVIQTEIKDNSDCEQDHHDDEKISMSYEREITLRSQEEEGAIGGCSLEKPLNTEIVETRLKERERLHSTDSENENNTGSRSPLLNSKKYENVPLENKEAAFENDKTLHDEIKDLQQKRTGSLNKIKSLQQAVKGLEIDSGCPSSDCEQVSASSKDLLLGSNSQKKVTSKPPQDNEKNMTNSEEDSVKPSTSKAALAKNQGAIPKTAKYRENDETRKSRRNDNCNASNASAGNLHKRRSASSRQGEKINENTANNVTLATTAPFFSSSTSTNSSGSSMDSFNSDFPTSLWPHEVIQQPQAKINPVHYKTYQAAMQALQEALLLNEGSELTEQMKKINNDLQSLKSLLQTSLPNNSSTAPNANNLGDSNFNNLNGSLKGRNSSALNRNFSVFNPPNHTTVTIQEALFNADRTAQTSSSTTSQATARGTSMQRQDLHNVPSNPMSTGSGQIITLDDLHCDNYCDYWRPAIILNADKKLPPKNFYKYRFKLFGFEHDFKISIDRLELLALFDRDLHWFHVVLSVILSSLVAYNGATILQHNYYKDLFAFLFCAVIAGAQYSLVKSVQPDAASPIHGFNKTVAYSRAIYFCICSGLLLWFKELLNNFKQEQNEAFIFFGMRYVPVEIMDVMTKLMYILLLCFPLIFSLGLFPQINTFVMYFLEQIDMHVFGGNAAGSLIGSFFCVLRSLLGISLLYGPLYATLVENKNTQYISFSIFCAMLVPMGYHLSRSASDFSHLWALIKHCIVSTYREDDDDLSGINSTKENHLPNGNKQRTTVSTINCTQKEKSLEQSSLPPISNKEHIEMKAFSEKASQKTEHSSSSRVERSKEQELEQENDQEQNGVAGFESKSVKSKASSLASSSQTLAKTLSSSKKLMTASSSFDSVTEDMEEGICPLAFSLNTDDRLSLGTKEQSSKRNNSENIKQKISENFDYSQNAKDQSYKNSIEEQQEKLSTSSTTQACDMSTLTVAEALEETEDSGFPNASNGNQNATNNISTSSEAESPDPLPKKLQNTVNTRLKNDFVVSIFLGFVVLGLHCSTVFTVLQPELNTVLCIFSASLGLLLHYIIPQLRKHMPWLCFAKPLFRQKEFGQFEVSNAPKIMWFEKFYIYFSILERNILFPLLIISAATANTSAIASKFGPAWGSLIIAICALKFIRNAYSDPTNQYLIVLFTVLLFRVDFKLASETFLIDYFFVSIVYRKCCDFLLKLQFIVTYIAPWQITWGSAFHAFAQPFSVPHSAMLFLQAAVSATLSTPLNPFLGSAIFLTSYVRPIKFWERDYNTRRIDHSNTRLSSQLERDLGADDNNLNSIFYEHLTRSLQHSLCGDLLMGRWGNVNQGDCFVLASDYLNCLVHIIELGNGLCTFQMRGLEFRGTYCQQREVEAITEDVDDNDGCCCCDPGHLPRMLSANAMFSTRWLAWQVVAAQYVLEGYSITDNLASATLQVFDYRKVLITYYIKSIIYYVVKNPKLEQWLTTETIQDALRQTLSRQFVDLDPIFNYNLDEDFDFRAVGITRSSFCYIYLGWINYCYDKRLEATTPKEENSTNNIGNSPPATNDQNNHQQTSSPIPLNSYQNATSSPFQNQPIYNLNMFPPNANNSTPLTSGGTPTTNVYNDSRSSPNLTTHHPSQNKSQSQQQLRSKSQKHSTMSDSVYVNNHLSNEQISSSQSFANISRQTSGSAPGLSAFQNPFSSDSLSLNQCALNVNSIGGGNGPSISSSSTRPNTAPLKSLRKEESLSSCSPKSKLQATSLNINCNQQTPQQPPLQMQQPLNQTAKLEETNVPAEKLVLKLKVPSVAKDSPIVSLCLALSLLARRSLATASHNSLTGVEYFLHGLHALFKGDFRIQSPRDEWVFADMELLQAVVAPAVKMALKLQQDHITNPDEYLQHTVLYEAIDNISKELVISHEADPIWRSAVLKGAPNLLALRHVMEDGSDEYRIIRLTKRFLSFRVIKLNRECVRGLWAGQQQELIYLRNRNPERGSIQNAKQALRNIINSSCDQPIGYPIYVSPLTTSYADTNEQLCKVAGGPITPESIKTNVLNWWHRVRERCRQGCSSGSGVENSQMGLVGGSLVGGVGGLSGANTCVSAGGTVVANNLVPTCNANGENADVNSVYISAPIYNTLTVGNLFGLRPGQVAPSAGGVSTLSATFGSDSLAVLRSSVTLMPIKPTSSTLIAGLLNREREQQEMAASKDSKVSSVSGLRKNLAGASGASSSSRSSERERRATLPIASTSLGITNTGAINSTENTTNNARSSSAKDTTNSMESSQPLDKYNEILLSYGGSPRYAKISTSSGSLGIGNIITNPGEYPRKNKGPICLTTSVVGSANSSSNNDAAFSGGASAASNVFKGLSSALAEALRQPKIELFKKVIIVDDAEIYDCLDMGRRVDFLWPNEEMRSNGGRFSWKDWEPRAGMVGYVVHCWIPNHTDLRKRSPINGIVYLVEIGEHYVPVGEYGLREYNQIITPNDEISLSRRSSIQRDYDEFRIKQQIRNELHRSEGLTPILGSSLESPKSQLSLASTSAAALPSYSAQKSSSANDDDSDDEKIRNLLKASSSTSKPKIQAVSSSSSEDELDIYKFEKQRRDLLLNMWKMIADKQKESPPETDACVEFEGFDYFPQTIQLEEKPSKKERDQQQQQQQQNLHLHYQQLLNLQMQQHFEHQQKQEEQIRVCQQEEMTTDQQDLQITLHLPEDDEKFESANDESEKRDDSLDSKKETKENVESSCRDVRRESVSLEGETKLFSESKDEENPENDCAQGNSMDDDNFDKSEKEEHSSSSSFAEAVCKSLEIEDNEPADAKLYLEEGKGSS